MGDLHVVEWGDGDPAVLVHGSFGWGEETWRAQRPLAARFRLLLVDRRGFGGTPRLGRVDFERDAGDVAQLLDGSHLVGHSYGGLVALLAAARRPGAVRSLAVIEPPAFGLVRGEPAAERFIERVDAAMQGASDPAEYRAGFLRAFGFSPANERLKDVAYDAALSSWTERPPYEANIPLDALREAPFPKLVVRGAWDRAPAAARERGAVVFHAICDMLERRLRAESATFPGAAHNPQLLGKPFNDRLQAFWEST